MKDPYEINWKIKEQKPVLPKILYKYRNIANPFHLETLTEQTIFLPSPIWFNDPFDCKIPLDHLKLAEDKKLQRAFAKKVILMNGTDEMKAKMDENIESFVSKGFLSDKKYLQKRELENVKRLNREYGIYSLSAVPNNLLMWSHYSDSHRGICLGFNAKKLQIKCKFSAGGPVTYFDTYPNMSLLRDNEDLFYNQLFNKSIDWLYEKEWRYIKIRGADTKVKFPADIIEEIYIGCMASKENQMLLKEIRASKYPSARLYKCIKSKKGYYLDREEI